LAAAKDKNGDEEEKEAPEDWHSEGEVRLTDENLFVRPCAVQCNAI
jgi:hypothetical protein